MVNLKKFVSTMNIFLGFFTIGIGITVLISFIFNAPKSSFGIVDALPYYGMPVYFALFGFMVLSKEFNVGIVTEVVTKYCQFMHHNVGLAIFYLYLSGLMSGFQINNSLIQLIIYCSSLGYLVLAVLFVAVHFCGESTIENKLNDLEEKITSDDTEVKKK